ncbi:hypothetical protein APHAL10511_007864, partial [Amanita phalloides]
FLFILGLQLSVNLCSSRGPVAMKESLGQGLPILLQIYVLLSKRHDERFAD